MTALSAGQLAYLASQAGFTGSAEQNIVAVDLAESGGRSDALGDTSLEDATWGPSVGVGQIRSLKAQYGTGGVRDQQANLNPLTNLQHEYELSKGGADLTPWSTWWGNAQARTGPGRGSFLSFLPQAAAGVASPQPVDLTAITSSPSSSAAQASTVGFSDLLPWNWGNAITGAGKDLVTAVFAATVNVAFIGAGLALVVVGVYKLADPGVSFKSVAGNVGAVAKTAGEVAA